MDDRHFRLPAAYLTGGDEAFQQPTQGRVDLGGLALERRPFQSTYDNRVSLVLKSRSGQKL